MIGAEQVSQNRYSHVQRTEVSNSSNSIVSRINSVVKNCWVKRSSQALFIGAAIFLTVACFSNPIGISIGLLTTAFIVSTLALSSLLIELLGSNKKSNLQTVEGRPSLIQNDFAQECRQIDSEKGSLDGAITNLYIDSLHDRVKNSILGEDLLDQIQDFSLRHPERQKDIVALKNILILNRQGRVDSLCYINSLKYNLEQLSVDVARGRKIKFEGELLQATNFEPPGFDALEGELHSPETVKMILQSIEAKFPNLSLADKNVLVANLHHGALYDFEKDLNEHHIGIQDSANTNVTRNADGSFSIEMDLLLKVIGDPGKAPLIPQDEEYKREIAKKFGRRFMGDHFFRSIVGCAKGYLHLETRSNKKYVRLDPIEKSPAYLGDMERVSLSSRPSSFSEEVPPLHPSQKATSFNWFSSMFKREPSRMEPSREDWDYRDIDVGIGGSFSDLDENSYSRGNSFERLSSVEV